MEPVIAQPVLVVEGDSGGVELVREPLAAAGLSASFARGLAAAERLLERGGYGAILLHVGLPDATAVDAVVRIRALAPTTAIVIITGAGDESVALACLDAGAHDYVATDELSHGALADRLHHAVARARSAAPERRAADSGRASVSQRTRRRVLVIDDDAELRAALVLLLSNFHDVVAVGSAAEALDVLAGDDGFEAILSDVMMRGMNGLELADQIESRHSALRRRIAFVSGGSFEPEIERAVERSGVRMALKPVPARILLALVEDLASDSGPDD